MSAVILILILLAAAVALAAWVHLPRWRLRVLRRLDVARLGVHATGEDLRLVEDWCKALRQGVEARIRPPRADMWHRFPTLDGVGQGFPTGGSLAWIARCEVATPRWRPQVLEGAATACGAVRWLTGRWDMAACRALCDARPQYAYPAHFGVGLWGALRYGKDFEALLAALHGCDPWLRFLCLDGYGFKFGLLDYPRDRASIAHLQTMPGYFRRAAFQGVGRAWYFVFLSDRRGLIEAAADFAPEHDGDLIEGAAFAAAYTQIDRPIRALHFARAMPYEWRAHAHLGITLGFRARSIVDTDYFRGKCLTSLPRSWSETIRHAIATADELEQALRSKHPAGGYGLWREKLAQQMQRDHTWEPVYVEASEQTRSGGGAVR